MSREANKAKLVQFLESIRRPDATLDTLDEGAGLVDAGLVDSLALLEIISFLESEFQIDFSETGIDPGQVSSVASILDLIDQREK